MVLDFQKEEVSRLNCMESIFAAPCLYIFLFFFARSFLLVMRKRDKEQSSSKQMKGKHFLAFNAKNYDVHPRNFLNCKIINFVTLS